MAENHSLTHPHPDPAPMPGRRGFFYTLAGGLVAALAGWISGSLPKAESPPQQATLTPPPDDARIAGLEAEVQRLSQALLNQPSSTPLGELEGEFLERVVFNKRELTVANPEGVLVNLVATNGHVGFRFYKDFYFGNETEDSPWSIFIEGIPGYQGLAFLRDWRFTAALWDDDGKLLLGRLHPHPPANEPAGARLHVRGTVDEVQTIIQAAPGQSSDVFQVLAASSTPLLSVGNDGTLHAGSTASPTAIILHDTVDGTAYVLKISNGQIILSPQ